LLSAETSSASMAAKTSGRSGPCSVDSLSGSRTGRAKVSQALPKRSGEVVAARLLPERRQREAEDLVEVLPGIDRDVQLAARHNGRVWVELGSDDERAIDRPGRRVYANESPGSAHRSLDQPPSTVDDDRPTERLPFGSTLAMTWFVATLMTATFGRDATGPPRQKVASASPSGFSPGRGLNSQAPASDGTVIVAVTRPVPFSRRWEPGIRRLLCGSDCPTGAGRRPLTRYQPSASHIDDAELITTFRPASPQYRSSPAQIPAQFRDASNRDSVG
jgi:hypothetical protein